MNKCLQMARNFVTNPKIRFGYLCRLGVYRRLPDEDYLKKEWRSQFGSELNLENPRTFNEKLQWLKIHDRKQEYTTMVDKYEAKKYVGAIIGEEHIIPTLGIWNDYDDIDLDDLPNQFILSRRGYPFFVLSFMKSMMRYISAN